MTEKQIKIVTTALQLFADQGFNGTSTSKIAKEAGVSEGLIFRHFENKEGLLKAILELGAKDLGPIYENLFSIESPNERIRAMIDLPFSVPKDKIPFWRLIYAMKWQADTYDDSISAPVKNALVEAFDALGKKNPKAEAELLMSILDGIAAAIILRKPREIEDMKTCLIELYKL